MFPPHSASSVLHWVPIGTKSKTCSRGCFGVFFFSLLPSTLLELCMSHCSPSCKLLDINIWRLGLWSPISYQGPPVFVSDLIKLTRLQQQQELEVPFSRGAQLWQFSYWCGQAAAARTDRAGTGQCWPCSYSSVWKCPLGQCWRTG